MDKDLYLRGNKLYSPDLCHFVPRRINNSLIKRDSERGKYPVGVTYNNKSCKFKASCSDGSGKTVSLGPYNTITEAFNIYKTYKESLIKDIASDFKPDLQGKDNQYVNTRGEVLHKNVVNFLLNYEVTKED